MLLALTSLMATARSDLAAAGPPIQVLSATSRSLRLLLTLPPYRLRPTEKGCVQVLANGLWSESQPGAPQLPQIGALFELPPGGHIAKVQVLRVHRSSIKLGQHICTTPPRATDVSTPPPQSQLPQDVSVKEVGWVRGHHLGRVLFRPINYDPTRSELTLTQRMVVEIHFADGGRLPGNALQTPASPTFEAVLSRHLLNHSAHPRHVVSRKSPPPIPSADEPRYKVIVTADGLYRLTCAELSDAGLPVNTLDPSTLQLFEGGEEIAVLMQGEQDGRCDPNDTLLFYGHTPHSRYTAHNVYWLRYGNQPGRRMTVRDVTPGSQDPGVLWTTARYGENRFYDSRFVAADGDHWYAADLRPGDGKQVTLYLQPLDSSVLTATLWLRLVGYTADVNANPDHHLHVAVNGQPVGSQWWEGAGAVTLTLTISRTLLKGGDNQLLISLPGDTGAAVEGVWLDSIELNYPLQALTGIDLTAYGETDARRYKAGGWSQADIMLLDITTPRRPVLLQGATISGSGSYTLTFADSPTRTATYLAVAADGIRTPASIVPYTPTHLLQQATGADYLIVTHPDFVEAIQPLVAHRQAQGLQVFVAEVQDIYDEFSYGLRDPEAIRQLIAAVMPTFVLLVGDGHYDFLDHYGYGHGNYLPPYLAMVDPWWGETATDNRYATVVGDDPLPDVLIGRLPVNTPTEAEIVVQKIVRYEESPLPGDWNSYLVFIADKGESFATSADEGYDSYAHVPRQGERIYLDDLSPDEARWATLAAWERGALLMSFWGHASWHQWSEENLFNINDLPSLHNDRQWPMVLSMTCFTGFFHHPEYATLDEALLRTKGGGAIATWSPSGLGVGSGHGQLHQGFYRAVFVEGQTQLGQATLAGRLALYANAPAYADLIDTYNLFGDPAMSLNLTIRPWPYIGYLPLVVKDR